MPTTFRKGDVVTIEATVENTPFAGHDGKPAVKIKFPPYHDAFVDPSQLTMVRPNFEVGDRVRWEKPGFDPFEGEVRATCGDHLWVAMDNGDFATVLNWRVERIEPEPVRSDGGANIVTKHLNIAGAE